MDFAYLVTSKVADLARTRALAQKFLGWFGAQEFDGMVAEAEWKASRGRI
jgi:hypothetical protein